MIDNVEISASKGTFPIFDDSEGDPLDDLPPEGVEFSMIVDITPEGTSLNAGSTTTFEAIVDWVGGDVETLSLELLRDGETVLLEQVSSADFNSDEGGYYYDLSGDYSSNIDGAFTVQLTAKDSSGVVVFTKDVEYQLYPI